MTYEIYRYIFYGGAILTGVMTVISAIVFFVLKIPGAIGDLTGSNARKAIVNIRNQSQRKDNSSCVTGQIGREGGRITDKMSSSGRVIQNSFSAMQTATAAGVQNSAYRDGANETTVLAEEKTAVIHPSHADETSVLGNENDPYGTTVLQSPSIASAFAVEYELTYIHTNEVIL